MARTVRVRVWAALVGVLGASSALRAQADFVNWESPHVNPLALTPSGDTLLAVNTADNRLEVFDVTPFGLVHRVSIPTGLDPVSVRARTETEAWVVNHISDSISIVDLTTGRVRRTLLTGDEPADVVFAGIPERAFVSVSQMNQVRVFDPANLNAAPTIVALQGEDPRAMVVGPGGANVYVAFFESGNKTTGLPRQAVSAPLSPYGGLNPPPNNGNQFSPPLTPGLPPPPPVGMIVRQNAAGQWMDDNNRNWSASVPWGLHDQDVAIVNTTTLGVTYARGLMTMVAHLALTPSGTVTAVGTEALNQIRFEPNVNAIFIRSQLASFPTVNPTQVTRTDLNPHLTYAVTTVPPATRELSLGDPRAIVWHPSGDRAFVAGLGSNNVVIIDPAGGRIGQVDTGEGPTGLAIVADGSRVFALNKFEGSISVIDTAAAVETTRVSFFDPSPMAIKTGRPLLYDTHRTSGLGQASCASCHIDGRNDGLAWDLGSPAGQVVVVNEVCRQGPGNCAPWHPMKGPMATQSLQGIVGVEPFHWRGDRADLAAFAPAFTGLQGADAEPTPSEMGQFTDFVATIQYPPNPLRNLDGSLPTALPVGGGTGNAQTGRNVFLNQNTLGPLSCSDCHALPNGTDQTLDFPGGGGLPQTLKIAQLRGMNEKTGFSRASLTNNRGFGYNHDSDRDSLTTFVNSPPFNFPPGPLGQQQRRDLEAFMLAFSSDTHAAVGQQVTFDGANNNDAQLLGRYNTFVSLADALQVGLVAKTVNGGSPRGYSYAGGNIFQSDRGDEVISGDVLRTSAAAGSEVTYTVVPLGSQTRIGVDRDRDTFFDGDELDAGSDPADGSSVPSIPGDIDFDTDADLMDYALFQDCFTGLGGGLVQGFCAAADLDDDQDVDFVDFRGFQLAFTGP